MNLVVDDELQALLLPSSLSDIWEILVVSFSNSAPNGVLQLAMVKDNLFNEETRRKDVGKDNAHALVTKNRGRTRGRNSKGCTQDDSTLDLWHKRLAHMSEKGLQILAKKSLIPFVKEYGIRHEKTVPGTPQHNGVAERINRTIVENVRCMLRMAKLPKSFWAKGVQTACYLINRSPSIPLDFEILERVDRRGCFLCTSEDFATNIEEVQVENYGDEPVGVDGDDAIDTKASLDLELEQMDVKTAFLHVDLEEEIYMIQPEGFEAKDDMLIVGQDANMVGSLKKELFKSLDMKDLGLARQILGRVISWQSKLQKCVTLSTTEAEYIAATEVGKEMLWMKRFLQDLGLKQDEYVVHCDSQSALDLSTNSTYHSRTKHIDAGMNSNQRVGMKISFLSGLEGEIVGCTAPCCPAHTRLKLFNELVAHYLQDFYF
uniref:Integrase catalytic domain-containing protein n=1 Tax=Fagus sylvatica TaxID=28930 RepID=A0A2N9FMC5_FAGSY